MNKLPWKKTDFGDDTYIAILIQSNHFPRMWSYSFLKWYYTSDKIYKVMENGHEIGRASSVIEAKKVAQENFDQKMVILNNYTYQTNTV